MTLADSTSPLYLVNRDGSYLLNPDPTKLFGGVLNNFVTFDNERSRQDVIAMFGENQGIITESSDHPDSLQVFVHIRPETQISIRWLLFRVIPVSSIVGEVNATQQVAILLALISLLVAILVALLLTRGIVRPVRQLAEVADNVRMGNWDVSVPGTGGRDEIGHLADAFDGMLRELKSVYGDLEDAWRAARRNSPPPTSN